MIIIRVGQKLALCQPSSTLPCFYPRTVTHRHSLILYCLTPFLSGTSSLAFSFRYLHQFNAELSSIRNICPLHVLLVLLTCSLILSMLILLRTSSFALALASIFLKAYRGTCAGKYLVWLHIRRTTHLLHSISLS